MGATKGSTANQVLEWAVGKLDEASKTDWVEKFSSMTSSKPAYLRGGLAPATPSRPAPAPAADAGSVSLAELDAALARAQRAEAKAAGLARRVAELEAQLAGTSSHPEEVLLPEPAEMATADAAPAVAGDGGDDEHHKHWWSRKH